MAKLTPFLLFLSITGVFSIENNERRSPQATSGVSQNSVHDTTQPAAVQPATSQQNSGSFDLNEAFKVYAANPMAFQGADVQKEAAKASSGVKDKRQFNIDFNKMAALAAKHPEAFQSGSMAATTHKSSSDTATPGAAASTGVQPSSAAPAPVAAAPQGVSPQMSTSSVNIGGMTPQKRQFNSKGVKTLTKAVKKHPEAMSSVGSTGGKSASSKSTTGATSTKSTTGTASTKSTGKPTTGKMPTAGKLPAAGKRDLLPFLDNLNFDNLANMAAAHPEAFQSGSMAATTHSDSTSSVSALPSSSGTVATPGVASPQQPQAAPPAPQSPVAPQIDAPVTVPGPVPASVDVAGSLLQRRQLDGVNELVENIGALPGKFSGGQTPGASGVSREDRLAQQQSTMPQAQPQPQPQMQPQAQYYAQSQVAQPQAQQYQYQPQPQARAQVVGESVSVPVINMETPQSVSMQKRAVAADKKETSTQSDNKKSKGTVSQEQIEGMLASGDSKDSKKSKDLPPPGPAPSSDQGPFGKFGTSIGSAGTSLGSTLGGVFKRQLVGSTFGELGHGIGTSVGGLFAPSGTYYNTQPAQPNPNGNPHNANGMQPGVGKISEESDGKETVSTTSKKDSKKDKRYYPSGSDNPRNANHKNAHKPDGGYNVDYTNYDAAHYGGDSNPRNSDQPGAHDPDTAGSYYRYGGQHKRNEENNHVERSSQVYPSGDDNPRNADRPGAHQPNSFYQSGALDLFGNDYYSQYDTDTSNPRNAHGLQPGVSAKNEKRETNYNEKRVLNLFGNDYYSQFDTDPSNPRNAHGLQPGLSAKSKQNEKRQFGKDNPRNHDQPGAHKPYNPVTGLVSTPANIIPRSNIDKRKLAEALGELGSLAKEYQYDFSKDTGSNHDSEYMVQPETSTAPLNEENSNSSEKPAAQPASTTSHKTVHHTNKRRSELKRQLDLITGVMDPAQYHGKNANGRPVPTGMQGQDGMRKRGSNISDKAFTGVPAPLVPVLQKLSGMDTDQQQAPGTVPQTAMY